MKKIYLKLPLDERCILDMEALSTIIEWNFPSVREENRDMIEMELLLEDEYNVFQFVEDLNREIKTYLEENLDRARHSEQDRLLIYEEGGVPIQELCYAYKCSYQEFPWLNGEEWPDRTKEQWNLFVLGIGIIH